MNSKQFIPYLIALATFVIVALVYFSPVLEGKMIYQSDIVQYRGMSKEIKDFRAEHHTEPYWTDAAFGGMPAYQVSAYYPHNYIKKLDKLIRFLPRPADYLFLYFLGFFVLMLILKVDWRLAIIGAIGFGFSTYLIIILGVGHNAKAHAIGYMPLVLAGVLLIFRKKYLIGFILTTLATSLEIVAGHVQMTYYLFFMLLILGVVYFIESLKEKEVVNFAKSSLVLILAGFLSILINANHLLPTREYAKESTRGQSELTITPEGKKKEATKGLSKEYITEYSYGILETFNLFIPRLMGGGNSENIGTDSHTYQLLKKKIGVGQAKDFAKHAPTYWGKQPIVAAPAYIGAVLIFLFIISLFLVNSKTKKWILGSMLLALFLSWGKNLSFLTEFFIDYIPLYHKFRAVTSIQVLLELGIPILGILGLQKMLFSTSVSKEKKEKALKYASIISGGIALFFLILGSSWFSFEGGNDAYYNSMIPGFSEALIQDRKALLFNDSLRTLILVLLAASTIWLFIKEKINIYPVLSILGILIVYDGIGVAKRYVNTADFLSASRVEKPFKMSDIDKAILQDKGHFRVANFGVNPMNDGSTSYFHKSIGGYHAAKPRRYQERFDFQISKNNMEVLNMLNTKNLILVDEKGQKQVQINEDIYGNTWFATDIIWVNNANEEIKALDNLTKEKAILNIRNKTSLSTNIRKDTLASIKLKNYTANQINYQSESKSTQLALFSEMYYPHGWKAFIDGKEQQILQANYVLRALVVPRGKHEIIFKFEPEVVKKGGIISLFGYVIFLILLGFGWLFRNRLTKG
jgi:hypothetical protein